MGMMDLFKTVIIVMLFYSFSVTILTYSMPPDVLAAHRVKDFTDVGNSIDMQTVREQVQGSVSSQLNIPVLEMATLIFFSGNVIVDLLLNFFFAIPQMLGLIIHGFTDLFNLPGVFWVTIELLASVVITVLYFIGILQLVLGLRSGGSRVL